MTEQKIIMINMRRAIEAVPSYRRASAGTKFISNFVKRHMKAQRVRIDVEVNDEIFKNGIQNPPTRIRVVCSKDDKNIVTVGLIKAEAAEKK